ncbi:dienelactone hydrolase family protein [Antarcticibacterium sp. 1MA-6-2]|uniref:dienelactone hydrolase family protein n=1 Tax=Antarcticibacterium sp. 1MA-6-2 TaxID=2908210 RepID=UPI001F286401|nr:dienelactone hydrolase family protein [Antarcticibacterium sp. 1MA-6-2]UJH91374.1 dienelactone hydrolase family protein [Antarcticibacterium sp. 1MA-6-2]
MQPLKKLPNKCKALSKTFDYKIYEGAGHAFMKRAHQPDASEANEKAHDAAWNRFLELLK